MLGPNYDSKNDILYLTFGNKNNSIGDEIMDGYVVMRDILTNEITGATIFDFMKNYISNQFSHVEKSVANYNFTPQHVVDNRLVSV